MPPKSPFAIDAAVVAAVDGEVPVSEEGVRVSALLQELVQTINKTTESNAGRNFIFLTFSPPGHNTVV